MDIIKFSSGEEFPVDFPFEAMVDLMGDLKILEYLDVYTSIRHQVKILETGLRYGMKDKFKMTSAEVRKLASDNPRQLREVLRIYDEGQLSTFLKVYFTTEVNEEKEELTEEEKKENEEAVKS